MSLRYPWDQTKKPNIYVIRILERQEKEGGAGKVLEEMMAVKTSQIGQET